MASARVLLEHFTKLLEGVAMENATYLHITMTLVLVLSVVLPDAYGGFRFFFTLLRGIIAHPQI